MRLVRKTVLSNSPFQEPQDILHVAAPAPDLGRRPQHPRQAVLAVQQRRRPGEVTFPPVPLCDHLSINEKQQQKKTKNNKKAKK